jgi:hypothetical protein
MTATASGYQYTFKDPTDIALFYMFIKGISENQMGKVVGMKSPSVHLRLFNISKDFAIWKQEEETRMAEEYSEEGLSDEPKSLGLQVLEEFESAGQLGVKKNKGEY